MFYSCNNDDRNYNDDDSENSVGDSDYNVEMVIMIKITMMIVMVIPDMTYY